MSGVDVVAVQKAAKDLHEAYEVLKKADDDLKKLRGLGGQTGYSVSIAGVSVQVAAMDPHYYSPHLIRGREMIHLGALKAMQGVVDHRKHAVRTAEQKLSALANVTGGGA